MEYPTLPTEIQKINNLLMEHFGVETESLYSIWRISWSNDQYEKRLTDCTDEGLQLLYPEIRLLPKYQWIRDRWILERLCLVPEIQQHEIPEWKKSYECMWKFESKLQEPIQPTFEACKFIVDAVYAMMGKQSMAKYKDPDKDNPQERYEERINKLGDELFGDESDLRLRTVTGEAIIVPQQFEKSLVKGES